MSSSACAATARGGQSPSPGFVASTTARYEYSPRKGTAFTLTAEALVGRLVALLPPARLTGFAAR